jgi:hypothetical protein
MSQMLQESDEIPRRHVVSPGVDVAQEIAVCGTHSDRRKGRDGIGERGHLDGGYSDGQIDRKHGWDR